jgi:hypothetical protein
MPDRRLRMSRFGRRWSDPDPALENLVMASASMVAYPSLPDLSGIVGKRLREAPSPSPWSARSLRLRLGRGFRPVFQPAWQPVAITLVVLIALLSGTLSVSPTARRAVADWLGLRGVRIEFSPTPSSPILPLGTGLNLGRQVTLAQAQANVPFRILLPEVPDLGPPDAVYLRTGNFAEQVTLLWRARPGLPKAETTGAGLLLTQFQATVDEDYMKKITSEATRLEFTRVNGGDAFWIEGPPHQVFLVDENGDLVPDTIRLAGNVLLWEKGELTLRIEAHITKDRALRIAGSVG